MNREQTLRLLDLHQPADAHEARMLADIKDFVRRYDNFHSRAQLSGHLTGSAWIVDEDRTHALLCYHGKFHCWVQLGGHVEDDPDMLNASLREAREESGLAEVKPLSDGIFDVDVHAIPANPKEPAHFHYDIRFLFTADRNTPFIVSNESKDLAWVELEKIAELTSEESVLRMVRKSLGQYPDR
ncbi:MAG TPA: NUDIX hydrolase [Blastocatellia bacterium]|jgi:ADP-ribose pyrophosphatase YjhB (NUDIX family)